MTAFNKNANKSNIRNFSFGRNPIPGQTGIKGQVLEISEPRQAQKYNANPTAPKALDWWDDEKTRPKMQVVLELQTDMNEGPSDDGTPDDGRRKVFVTVDYKPGGKMAAIQDAMEAAGRDDLEEGAFLALWFIGLDPESKNPDNPRKMFQATYQPPASAGGAFQPQQGQQAQQGYQAPQTQPAYGQPPQGQQFGQQTQQAQPAYGQPPQGQQFGQQSQPAYGQPPQGQQGFGQQNGGTGGFGAPPQGQQTQPTYNPPAASQQGEVNFTTHGPVNTATGEIGGAYPPPQRQGGGAPNLQEIVTRLNQGQSPAQISAETGAPMDAIQAVINRS